MLDSYLATGDDTPPLWRLDFARNDLSALSLCHEYSKGVTEVSVGQ